MNQVKETTQTNARIFSKNTIQNAKNHKNGQKYKTALSREAHIPKNLVSQDFEVTLSVACVYTRLQK
jgi:hypothetical protein